MTNFEEQQLFAALRGEIIYPDPTVNSLMEATAIEDLEAIRPVVDEFIRNAESRGKFEALLEAAAKAWERQAERERAAA